MTSDKMLAALKGEAAAQLYVGRRYQDGGNGEDWPYSLHAARWWYKKAAEQGHALAQYEYGQCNLDKTNLHPQEALKWFRKAAEQGYDEAQFWVAMFYADGYVVEKDPVEALYWLKRAAAQGHELALKALTGQ